MKMEVPQQIQEVVSSRQVVGLTHPDAPIYYPWVFDPRSAKVHLGDDHAKERRHKNHHHELAGKAGHHPARVHGYAYRIRGGWRITDTDHKKVDPFVAKQVVQAISERESSDGATSPELGSV